MRALLTKRSACLFAGGLFFALSGCAKSVPIDFPPAPPPPPIVAPPPPPPPPPNGYSATAAAYQAQLANQNAEQQRQSQSRAEYDIAKARYEAARAAAMAASGRTSVNSKTAQAANAIADPASGITDSRVPCAQLGRLADANECASYSALYAAMQSGIAAFDPPRKMDMGKSYPVKLVIGSTENAAQVIDTATDAGSVKTVTIKLGAWVCAELLAAQFKLEGPARVCKERGASPMLSWDWTVAPNQDGQLKLGVKLESFAEKNGKPMDAIDSRMIAVDVRADAIGKADMMVSRLTESFGGLRTMLLALLSVLGVLSVIIWRIKHLGQKPDADALKDLTAT